MSATLTQIRNTLDNDGSYMLCETSPGTESAAVFEPVLDILANCQDGILASHFQSDSAAGTVFLVVKIDPGAVETIKNRLLASRLPRDVIFYFYGPQAATQKSGGEKQGAPPLPWRISRNTLTQHVTQK